MKLANNITLRVFCNPEDDCEKVKRSLETLSTFTEEEQKKEKIQTEEIKAKGLEENIIKILTTTLEKDRHCNQFLKDLKEQLSETDRKLLVEQTNRLDDNLNFFIRLDKKSLLENRYELTDSGDCFHIKINIAAFPRNKYEAHKVVKEIFS